MVDTVDTRNMTDHGQRQGYCYKLLTGELKKSELDVTIKASILGVGCSISQAWNIVGRQSLVFNCS